MTISEDIPAGTEVGRRLALVIGVNAAPQSHLLSSLNYAVADADEMGDVLQRHCGFTLFTPPLLAEKATSNNVKDALLDLVKEGTENDFLLLYFSGHSLPMIIEAERRDIYLVTTDFNEQRAQRDENRYLSMGWLRDKFYFPARARRVLLILDCCYAGDFGRTAPDPYLQELKQRIAFYFDAPGRESGARSKGLRLALTATGHDQQASEQDGHGRMTGILLPALRGEVEQALDSDGYISVDVLYNYLQRAMVDQSPSLSGDFAGLPCTLAKYAPPGRMQVRAVREWPTTYIPFRRNYLFQERSGELEHLETLLLRPAQSDKSVSPGLIGLVGIGGVGKTQLVVELAYRCQERQHFPGGIFWLPATGSTLADWQRHFADLALKTAYLPPDDDSSRPENEALRARHLCRYLARHADALLMLDNVETPDLLDSALPDLAGGELSCKLLYTSRVSRLPKDTVLYTVETLPAETALHLLLAMTRPAVLAAIIAEETTPETMAARTICRRVDGLPLALVHLRSYLEQDVKITLVRLEQVLAEHGALELTRIRRGDATPLFATFALSWERVLDEDARHLFKLACYFPAAAPIPLWLLGLAAGLGEHGDIFEPLGQVRIQLQERSLLESLADEQARIHPLLRDFGLRLVIDDGEGGQQLLEKAAERLLSSCMNLAQLEQRALHKGYYACLEQIRAIHEYVVRLGATKPAEQIRLIQQWLDQESYLLAMNRFWPQTIPGLFRQQLHNRFVEIQQAIPLETSPSPWIKLVRPLEIESPAFLRVFADDTGPVISAVFIFNGQQVLTYSYDGVVQRWNTASGRQLVRFRKPIGYSAAASADSLTVLISLAKVALLIDTIDGRELTRYEGHTGKINSVAFSPDGQQVLTGSDDKTARLWHTASGQELVKYKGHTEQVSSVAFAPNGQWILTGSFDMTARLWHTASGKQLTKYKGHRRWIRCVAFSPNGLQVLTGSNDETARLWDTVSGHNITSYQGHASVVMSVAFSPNGQQVLTGSLDGTARLWSVISSQEPGRQKLYKYSVLCLALSPDGQQGVIGSAGMASLWKLGSREEVITYYTDSAVQSVAFSPDDQQILTGCDDGTVQLWDTVHGKELVKYAGHTETVWEVAFSPDGQQVLTGSGDGTARLWDAQSGHELMQYKGHKNKIVSVAFSPDGQQILTGSLDNTAQLWDAISGSKLVRYKGHTSWVRSVAFSPDGQQIVTGSSDGTARLWDLASGQELAKYIGHPSYADLVAFSPNGHLVLTCDMNGRVCFWRTKERGEGSLLGLYSAPYFVAAVYWQDANHLILVDKGGAGSYPHPHHLELMGKWQ